MDKREYMIKKDSVGKSKKTVAGLLMIAFILLLSSMTTQAASVKWKSLYRNFLARNERSYPYFTVLNIDKKGTPELIVAQDVTCYWYNVYSIKNNKVKYAGYFTNQFYGSTIRYNKKQKGICGFWSGAGSVENFFYTMSNGKLRTKCYILWDNNYGKSRCSVNHKRCSQKTAQKYRTRYFQEKNMIKYKCKKNTRGNRNRYIK